MDFKPIFFNTPMVKAILDGRKTCTRRAIKLDLGLADMDKNDSSFLKIPDEYGDHHDAKDLCRYKVGDILWVRETWQDLSNNEGEYVYFADGDEGLEDKGWGVITTKDIKWRPSIHMPRKAARIFLKVTDIRVEKLQDISEEQAVKEGIARMYDHIPDVKYEAWAKRVCQGKKKNEWDYLNYLWHGHFGAYGNGNKLSDAWNYQYSGYESAIGSFSSLWNVTIPLKEWNLYGWEANPYVWCIPFKRVEAGDIMAG